MAYVDFLKDMLDRWNGASTARMSRVEFLKQLAVKTEGLPIEEAPTSPDLNAFRRLIMDRPDDLRRKLLGANALRRRTLSPEQRRLLDNLDVEPDLLAPIDELRYEPTHTRLVEYFLSMGREARLPQKLVRDFLELVQAPPELIPDDLSQGTMRRERFSTEGRVDLWLEFPKLVVLVEMKVDAVESEGQLSRYRKALDEVRGDRVGILAYMTLPDAPRSDTKVPHVHFTLHDLLRAWIPYADTGHGLAGYLGRYLKSIAQLVERAGPGRFDDWTVRQQRAAIELFKTMA